MTKQILDEINLKDKIYGQFTQNKDPNTHKEYSMLLREVNRSIRKAKFMFPKNKFIQSKNDIKNSGKISTHFLAEKRLVTFQKPCLFKTEPSQALVKLHRVFTIIFLRLLLISSKRFLNIQNPKPILTRSSTTTQVSILNQPIDTRF